MASSYEDDFFIEPPRRDERTFDFTHFTMEQIITIMRLRERYQEQLDIGEWAGDRERAYLEFHRWLGRIGEYDDDRDPPREEGR